MHQRITHYYIFEWYREILRRGQDSLSPTVNRVPSVEFHNLTLVIMIDSLYLTLICLSFR